GEISAEDGTLKIKLTSEEFLSGLRKGDKLIPIITAVVYFGDTPWDGPRSLHDMLNFKNDAIKSYVPDYKLNLISPADMEDEEFTKFSTDLGFAMEVIKHQSSDADEVIERTNHRKIDRDTALFLNTAVKLNLEYEEETGGVDMCKAMEKKEKKDKILAVIDYMRDEGKSESDIIDKIIEKYHVTKEYVLALLAPQKV
ncbi:MAG: Rpn family recombination-promoting nuclease/putative transposase, partial [Lachnospiraceae bacterium]|nr:Rpn family recombination-promoting nuclease/putative transposase [Lachnospiraceae bacterium]